MVVFQVVMVDGQACMDYLLIITCHAKWYVRYLIAWFHIQCGFNEFLNDEVIIRNHELWLYHNAKIERLTPATDICDRGDLFKDYI